MVKQIQKVSNSKCGRINLSHNELEIAGMKVGDLVRVIPQKGKIVIERVV